MKTEQTEQQLAERLGQQLRDSEDGIDELTAARLRAARRQALDAAGKRHYRYRAAWSLGGFATASVALLAVMLWSGAPEQPVPALAADDWALLADGDLQLLEDHEFHDGLPEEDAAG